MSRAKDIFPDITGMVIQLDYEYHYEQTTPTYHEKVDNTTSRTVTLVRKPVDTIPNPHAIACSAGVSGLADYEFTLTALCSYKPCPCQSKFSEVAIPDKPDSGTVNILIEIEGDPPVTTTGDSSTSIIWTGFTVCNGEKQLSLQTLGPGDDPSICKDFVAATECTVTEEVISLGVSPVTGPDDPDRRFGDFIYRLTPNTSSWFNGSLRIRIDTQIDAANPDITYPAFRILFLFNGPLLGRYSGNPPGAESFDWLFVEDNEDDEPIATPTNAPQVYIDATDGVRLQFTSITAQPAPGRTVLPPYDLGSGTVYDWGLVNTAEKPQNRIQFDLGISADSSGYTGTIVSAITAPCDGDYSFDFLYEFEAPPTGDPDNEITQTINLHITGAMVP